MFTYEYCCAPSKQGLAIWVHPVAGKGIDVSALVLDWSFTMVKVGATADAVLKLLSRTIKKNAEIAINSGTGMRDLKSLFRQFRFMIETMRRKILFSPQEIGVDASIHPQIPPEFTQPVKPTAIGSVEIGG